MKTTKTIERMFDEDGCETDDVTKAVRIVVTDYAEDGHVISERIFFQREQ